jgi:hypothetical protein
MRTSLRLAKQVLASPQYGRYPLLHHSTAMTTYPDIRPVPARIPRPVYVPSNFFDVRWGDHDSPGSEDDLSDARTLDREGMEGVRRAGRMAGEVLREVGKLIKVGRVLIYRTHGGI